MRSSMRAESAQNPAEEAPEQGDHGWNSYRKPQIEFVVKSLILRLHRILTNNSGGFYPI
jgi:hypothetical protein